MKCRAFINSLSSEPEPIKTDAGGYLIRYRATRDSRPVALDGTTFQSLTEARLFWRDWKDDTTKEG